jgi:uncharacterized protein YjcR
MGRISKERRAEMLGKIERGEKVGTVAADYGIKETTVRSWIQRNGEHTDLLEVSRLRRENEDVPNLVEN